MGAGLTCLLGEEGPGCALLVMLLEGAFPAWSQTTGNSSSTGEFVPAGLSSRDWKVYPNVWRTEGAGRSWKVLFLGLLENSAAGRNSVNNSSPLGFVQKWERSFQRSRGLFLDRCRTVGIFSGKG